MATDSEALRHSIVNFHVSIHWHFSDYDIQLSFVD